MSASGIQVDSTSLGKLQEALAQWQGMGKSADNAFLKAARLTSQGMHQALRETPPRPRLGRIFKEAKARGYEMQANSDSTHAARKSARKWLGSEKSGYFRISEENDAPVITPIIVGRKGGIVASSRKVIGQRGELLTRLSQLQGRRAELARKVLNSKKLFKNAKAQERLKKQLAGTNVPAGAVKLNIGALTVAKAIQIRARAARGGHMAAQFLVYRKMKQTKDRRFTMYTENDTLASEVNVTPATDGGIGAIQIRAFLPKTSTVVQRIGAVPRAIRFAAATISEDIRSAVQKKWQKTMGAKK